MAEVEGVDNLSNETKQGLRKGGFRATMFIFFMTGLENIGFVANMVSMVLYFLLVMHFNLADSATTLTNFMGSTFLLTLVGGFIADTYLTRLNTVLLFACFEILGYILAIIQAHRPSLRPPGQCLTCKLEGKNAAIFYLSLCLLALGFGGIRGSYPALGGDQFDKNNPKEKKAVGSFFNWLLMSITLGATLGVTVIVWVSTEKSWALGFFIGMICAFLGFCIITAGKPFYRVRIVKDSPLIRLFQVMVAAIRNRKLSLPENPDELHQQYISSSSNNNKKKAEDEEIIPHSTQFRCLDKAAIILPRSSSTSQLDPWRVCTVSQVEELKIIIRMLPVLGSTILMNTCLAQLQTFTVQQGNIMDLHLGSFKVPAASIPVIPLIFMSALVPVYELIFIPFARRFTRHPNGITTLQRVGVGLVLSAISMAIGALIEVKRRNAFNNTGKLISLFWLSFQYGVFGIADLFTFVGLLDFFYSEAPACLRSLSTSFSWLSLSLGYFLSTVLVRVVNSVTAKGTSTGHGWLYGIDLNKNRLDLFYWFLAILSCLNFVLYLLCAKWYKYRKDMDTYNSTV
ncbi:Proton-dependent oligopeptide transporter family protein, partial [Dioscorea alata]